MPRSRERSTNKAKWSSQAIKNALDAIESGQKLREVSRTFGIPLTTLHDRYKSRKIEAPRMGRKPLFTANQETEMKEHVLKMAKLFYGITPLELRRLAFEFAEKNRIAHPFRKESRLAGKDWLAGFLRRNNELSLR